MGKLGPLKFPDNLHKLGLSVWRRLHIRMNLLMLTWEATYIAFVIAPRNTRKEKGDIFKMKNKMTQPHKAT